MFVCYYALLGTHQFCELYLLMETLLKTSLSNFYLKHVCLFVSSNTKIILCALNPQSMSMKVLKMTLTRDIFRRRHSKSKKVTLIESSRGYYICISSNKTPPSPTSGTGSKIKSLTEEDSDYELPPGSRDDFLFLSIGH